MALPDEKFYEFGKDIPDIFGRLPYVRLDDLLPFDHDKPVKLSVLIAFSSWRREQLARTLETIARQTFREFEVLVCDMDSGQDMESVYSLFRPYVRMITTSLKREGWSSCPSKGFKNLLPLSSGEVVAFMQPEMMLHPDAFWYLYNAHFTDVPHQHEILYGSPEGDTYVNIKNSFLSKTNTLELDGVDWHTNLDNVQTMTNYWKHREGLSGRTNRENWNGLWKNWIWWFASSAKRSSTLWDDLPSFDGHGAIDMFIIQYKKMMGFREIIPQINLAYHQEHTRASVAPQSEEWVWDTTQVRDYLKRKGRL